MVKSLALWNFIKVFPLTVLTSAMFFVMYYFLNAPVDGSQMYLYLGISVVGLIGFVIFYSLHNKAIASEALASMYDEDATTIKEDFANMKGNIPSFLAMFILFFFCERFLLPSLAGLAGQLFQISIAGFEFNILTLIINMGLFVWLFVGTAQISIMDIGIKDTFSTTLTFIFNNFTKVIAFCLFVFVIFFLFNLMLVVTYNMPQMIIVLKVFVFAYLIGVLNSVATVFFAENITEDDLNDDEGEYEEEE